jgi:hypothetical protein
MEGLSARCHHCGWQFGQLVSPFHQASVDTPAVTPEETVTTRRPGVPRPAFLEIEDDASSQRLEISFSPLKHLYTNTAIRLTYVGGMSVALGVAGFFSATPFVGILAALGAPLLIQGVAGWVRKIRLRVGQHDVQLSSSFLWPSRTVRVSDIEQLYVKEHPVPPAIDFNVLLRDMRRGRRFPAKVKAEAPRCAYMLKAKLANHEDVTLLQRLKSPVFALFIEQELERRMGIEDVAVAREYERPGAVAPRRD